ncbi:MAG TPA: 3-hydroxyacyl-CoA dehydrogenase NAD-binding domain-containing protein [Polyangiaceae bacterium]|nr:3-hydroxyacyl-CoA dehydrogenase NAD-binding domain-containing protein [Polyangiaceae bacterium]
MTAVLAVLDRVEEPIVSIEVRRDGVAVVSVDDVREADNAITMAFQAQLLAAIARIEEDASIAAAVLTSGKPSGFMLGLSPSLLTSIKFASDAERMATELGHALRRLEGLRKPVVAAVHGAALGGGFELALACHAIVASDDPSTAFGLTDVHLGLVPAANGVFRVVHRAGLRAAIELAAGDTLRGPAARGLGLVDDVCPRAIMVDAAARHAKALVGHVPRVRDERGDFLTLAFEKNRLGRRVLFGRAREQARARTGGHYPAPSLVLDVLERFADKGFDEGARLEAKVFGDLVVSETAHRLIELSLATAALRIDPGVSGSEKGEARRVQRIALLGGGSLVADIACAAASSGVSVRLRERDDGAIGRTLRNARGRLADEVARGALTTLEAEHVFARLSATTDFSGLRNADAVIDAVPDDLTLKQEMLRQVEALVGPRCVYASRSSFIPIAKIAHAAANPERVLGMHYCNPVPATPLLEVIRADKTAPWAVATAVAIGKLARKTVIVVKDGPGFYTTRVFAPVVNEALQLLAEGVAPAAIDAAVVEWGFPAGPLQILDELGIDAMSQVTLALHAAFGPRMTPPGALAALVADDRRGRKNGRGIYRYEAGRGEGVREAKRLADPTVFALLGIEPRTKLPVEEIQLRCALSMVNEAVRSLGDGVLRDPRDGDVGAIFGLGFPRFRGGPFRYVDTIGAADVVRRVQAYADRFGERWRPAPLLVQMAKKGERFFS